MEFSCNFADFKRASDGKYIIVNAYSIAAVEAIDEGTIRVMIGSEWIEFKCNVIDFFNRLRIPVDWDNVRM